MVMMVVVAVVKMDCVMKEKKSPHRQDVDCLVLGLLTRWRVEV